MSVKRAAEEAQAAPAQKKKKKKGAASGVSPLKDAAAQKKSVASGASPPSVAPPVPPLKDAPAQKKSAASGASPPSVALNLTELLEKESSTQQFTQWLRGLKTFVDQALVRFLRQNQSEVAFAVPETCHLFPPLPIA